MKKLLTLTLTLLLPMIVFAQGNKALTKAQQNLQKRNEQIVRRLQNLGRAYNKADKKEIKEEISKNIDMEFDRWYLENMQVLSSVEKKQVAEKREPIKEKLIRPGESLMDFSEELQQEESNTPPQEEPAQMKDPEQLRQEMLAEIKAGKIPEIMYKTVSDQVAVQLKQRAEMQNKGKNTSLKQKENPKQKGKGFNFFKK
ncbi:MAG: hypothetical protein K6E94_02515 [Elusimicrobiaceae bacterium]|nr:hypothetical protein [Elusimicrobiaceae bacterium]